MDIGIIRVFDRDSRLVYGGLNSFFIIIKCAFQLDVEGIRLIACDCVCAIGKIVLEL